MRELSGRQSRSSLLATADIYIMLQDFQWNRRHGTQWVVTLGVLSLAFAALGLNTTARTGGSSRAWPGFALALVAAGWVIDRSRLDRAWLLVLPVGCDIVIACLRQARGRQHLRILAAGRAARSLGRARLRPPRGGADRGRDRRDVLAPDRPRRRPVVSELRLAGRDPVGRDLDRCRDRRAPGDEQPAPADRVATGRALELDRLVATQTSIATARFDVHAVLDTVVAEALAMSSGDGAVIELPEGDEMVYTAGAGSAEGHVGVRLARAGSMSGLALETRETLYCRDSDEDGRVDREAAPEVGARSMIVVPLVHDGRGAGVLKVYAGTPDAFDEREARVLELLASMIAAALVRAELMQTAVRAGADRRADRPAQPPRMDRQLKLAMARCTRTGQPLSVVVMDVDGLKQVNDRDGHAAGDQYLRDISAAWAGTIRETDSLGRIGGDEFALLLEGADGSCRGGHAGAPAPARRPGPPRLGRRRHRGSGRGRGRPGRACGRGDVRGQAACAREPGRPASRARAQRCLAEQLLAQDVAERPARLGDARALVGVQLAGAAAVVALDRPDRQHAQPDPRGEPLQPPGVVQVRHLGRCRVVVDAGQDRVALHRPQLLRGLARVQAVQLVEQAVRGADRGRRPCRCVTPS